MKIILKKEVIGLGEAGDIVNVKTGYALNYLVPQGFATVGTPSAIKQHEETLRQRAHKEAKLVADAQALAAKASAVEIKIAAKVGELIAKNAQEAGVQAVVFDRNGYLYHGRIKELADAARNGGLKF